MTLEIASLQNPRVKQAVKLRESRSRQSTGLTLIDGFRELQLALAAGIDVVDCFVSHDSPNKEQEHLLNDQRLRDSCRLTTPDVMAKIAYGERSRGPVAIARIPTQELQHLQLRNGDHLVLVLDAIEKPGNIGAMFRTADAAGVDAVILSEPICELHNPNVIRASQGTVFSVPTARGERSEVMHWLAAHQSQVFTAEVEAGTEFTAADLSGRTTLVVGNESAGLGGHWSDCDRTAISIPMRGSGDSLNVSITAAVILYESLRQRGV